MPTAPNGMVGDMLTRIAGRDAPSRIGSWLPVASILAALVVVDVSASVLPGGGAFLLLLIPVMAASVIGGTRAGLLTLFLGALGSLALAFWRGHPWLAAPSDLLRLLLFIAEGGFVVLVVSALRTAVRRTEQGRSATTMPAKVAGERLTPREVEILGLAAAGLSTGDIGRELHLSRNTVKSHLAGAYGKLGAHNRAQAIGAGLRLGYIDADTLRASPDPDTFEM